jgi:hypothetical protein
MQTNITEMNLNYTQSDNTLINQTQMQTEFSHAQLRLDGSTGGPPAKQTESYIGVKLNEDSNREL